MDVQTSLLRLKEFGIPENVAEKATCKLAIKISEIFRLITVIQDGVKSDTITYIVHDHTALSLQARHFDKWPVVLERQNIPHCLILADAPAACQPLCFSGSYIFRMYRQRMVPVIEAEMTAWKGWQSIWCVALHQAIGWLPLLCSHMKHEIVPSCSSCSVAITLVNILNASVYYVVQIFVFQFPTTHTIAQLFFSLVHGSRSVPLHY